MQKNFVMEQKSKLCPHCKKEVDIMASRCPHCHGKIYVWTKGRKILLGFISFTIVILVFSSLSGKSENTLTSSIEQTSTEPAIKVTASKLASDYEANEVSADATYKGKILEVTGTIENIGKDILDTPYVALSNGVQYSFTSIQCMFDKSDQSQLTTLSKNTKITLRGKNSGKLGNIILRECSIVK